MLVGSSTFLTGIQNLEKICSLTSPIYQVKLRTNTIVYKVHGWQFSVSFTVCFLINFFFSTIVSIEQSKQKIANDRNHPTQLHLVQKLSLVKV